MAIAPHAQLELTVPSVQYRNAFNATPLLVLTLKGNVYNQLSKNAYHVRMTTVAKAALRDSLRYKVFAKLATLLSPTARSAKATNAPAASKDSS